MTPKQILLVRDSSTIARMVEITFAHEEYVVTTVKNGDEAVASARAIGPNVVLIDASLTGRSAYDICAALREAGVRDVPVVLLTGHLTPYDQTKGLRAGVDSAVIKPFDTQYLIDKVGQLIAARDATAAVRPARAAPQGLAIGDKVGNYVVEAAIGEGGMARLFRVRHALLGTLHAMKVLDSSFRERPEVRRRFLSEGVIAANLNHPNVVRVTETVQTPEVAGLVMELVQGPNLEQYLRGLNGPPSTARVQAIFLPVLAAIGEAHRRGIIHRDIKPANILLAVEGEGMIPKVTDFGIAKITDVVEGAMMKKGATRAEAQMGTPSYMSPEQIRGAKEVTVRSDIFSLGATLYELATCHVAFDGDSDYDIKHKIVQSDYAPPELVSGVDPAIAAAIRCALQPSPERRFGTCEEFAAAVAQRPITAPPGEHEQPPAEVNRNPRVQPAMAAEYSTESAGPDEVIEGWRKVVMANVAARGRRASATANIDEWRKVVAANVGLKVPRSELARILREAERWNALVELLKEQAEKLPSYTPDERVATLFELADIYKNRLKLDVMVINSFNAILALQPTNARALDALAAQYEAMKRWPDLISVLQKKAATETEYDAQVALHSRIASLFQEKVSNAAGAVEAFEKVLELAPQNAPALAFLKVNYEKRRDWEKLIAVHQREIERIANPSERGQKFVEVAKLASETLKKPSVSIELWQKVLDSIPEHAEALAELEKLYDGEILLFAVKSDNKTDEQRKQRKLDADQISQRLGGIRLAEVDLSKPEYEGVRKPKTGSLLQLSQVRRDSRRFVRGYKDSKMGADYAFAESGPGAMGYEAGWTFAQVERALDCVSELPARRTRSKALPLVLGLMLAGGMAAYFVVTRVSDPMRVSTTPAPSPDRADENPNKQARQKSIDTLNEAQPPAMGRHDIPATTPPLPAPEAGLGHAHAEKGRKLSQEKKWAEAVLEFQAAIQAEPSRGFGVPYWIELGYAQEKDGDVNGAIDTYKHYLKAWPDGFNADEIAARLKVLSGGT